MSRLQMTAAGRGWKKLRHIRSLMVRNRAVYDLTGQFFTSHHLPGSEKTRPVAISSTTLQPHFRFHLNATCAVRDDPHRQVDREKKTNKQKKPGMILIVFVSESCLPADVPEIVSVVSEPFLGGFLLLKNPSGRKGEGERRRNGCFVLSDRKLHPKVKNVLGSTGVLRCLALLSHDSGVYSHSEAPQH